MSKNKLSILYYLLMVAALFGAILLGCSDDDTTPPVGPDGDYIGGTVSAFVFDSVFLHWYDSSLTPYPVWPLRNAEVVCLYSDPATGKLKTISGSTDANGLYEFSLELKSPNDSATIYARHLDRTSHVHFVRFDQDDQFLEVPIYMDKFIVPECTWVNIIEERVPVGPSVD